VQNRRDFHGLDNSRRWIIQTGRNHTKESDKSVKTIKNKKAKITIKK
jgi:hypothetical protein